jgi:hypothetical protein
MANLYLALEFTWGWRLRWSRPSKKLQPPPLASTSDAKDAVGCDVDRHPMWKTCP